MHISRILFVFLGYLLFYALPLFSQLQDCYHDKRRYNEVCWLTAHNAFASRKEGWFYAQQTLSFDEQFAYGVRAFMVDFHWYQYSPNELAVALCHGDNAVKPINEQLGLNHNCPMSRLSRLGEVPQKAFYFLSKVRTWLERDPHAIITLHLESYLGEGSRKHLLKLFEDSGLRPYLYQPTVDNYKGQWPTLGQLRESGQRLIIFSNNLWDIADVGKITLDAKGIAGPILHVFAYRETQYNLGQYPACELRTDGHRNNQAALFVMNHFYGLSSSHIGLNFLSQSIQNVDHHNDYDSIWKRVDLCYQEQKRLPNFIAVDFVEQGANGGARAVVSALNQLPSENYHQLISLFSSSASDFNYQHKDL